MTINSRQLLLKYANRGVNYRILRYSREMDYIKYKVVDKHFEYETEDVEHWINNFIRAKDGKRGMWRGK